MKRRHFFWGIAFAVAAAVAVFSIMYWADFRKMRNIAAQAEKEALNFHSGTPEAYLLIWLKNTGFTIEDYMTERPSWLSLQLMNSKGRNTEIPKRKADEMLREARKRDVTLCGNSDFVVNWRADAEGIIREFYFRTRPCWMDAP